MSHTGDFLPRKEADLLAWSVTFNTKINATPVQFGLDAAQASGYTTLHDAFATAYQITKDRDTRTPSSIVTKREAMKALKSRARHLAKIIQAFPGTTDTMRSDLGLTIPDVEPTPVPRPSQAPQIDLLPPVVRTVSMRLHNKDSLGRSGKPHGVKGALVFSYVGPTPPSVQETNLWKFETNTTRTSLSVTFPPTVPSGATVWITAFWYNTKGESGPATPPKYTLIPGEMSQAA